MAKSDKRVSCTGDAARFATTQWSEVLAAGDSSSPRHSEALSGLCQKYWKPLYTYLRRRGYDPHRAEDNTQAFIARMLEKRYLQKVTPAPGKFRSFLLTALKHFLANEYDREHAVKRGGHRTILSLDFVTAENHYTLEPADDLSPEKLFEKAWALSVLEQALVRLSDEMKARDKHMLFNQLRPHLASGEMSVPYREVAANLNMAEGAVRVAVHRMRRRYRVLLREEIAQTLDDGERVDEELATLFSALSS